MAADNAINGNEETGGGGNDTDHHALPPLGKHLYGVGEGTEDGPQKDRQ